MTSALTYPEILARLPERGPVCIEASAGTGKTYTLEHLLLKVVVEEGVPIERVLVVTFTEKATLELRARLRERLLEARAALDAEAGRARGRDDALRRIEGALRAYDRTSIATIHGFCQQVLADAALPAGLLLEQEVVTSTALAESVLREIVRERVQGSDLAGHCLRVLLGQHDLGALTRLYLKLAGHEGPIEPPCDLAAFQAAVPADYPDPAAIEAWGQACFPRSPKARPVLVDGFTTLPGLVAGLTDLAEILDPEGPFSAWLAEKGTGATSRAKIIAKELVKPKVAAHPLTPVLLDTYQTLQDRLPSPAAYLAHHLFPEVDARIDARKRGEGLLDYDDMLRRLDQALGGPEGEALARAVRARYEWVLIDEFQDTDALQWRIFRRLFWGSDAHRIVVVGDPKQAIYAFRGGDLPVYLEARAAIEATGNPVLRLDTSYRSTARMLSILGRLFGSGTDAPAGTEGGPFFTVHSHEDGEAGSPEYLDAPPLAVGRPDDALLDPGGQEAAPLVLLTAPNDRTGWPYDKAGTARLVYREVAREILRLTSPEHPFLYRRGAGAARPLRHSDCMVLCRTNAECEAAGRALAEAGIPHAFFKRPGLGATPEAEHLRILLRALLDPHDASARARLWLTPFFELPLSEVEAARALPASHPLHATVDRWCELAARRRFEALFEAVLVESGLCRRLALREDERALTNYQHLTEVLLAAARAAPLTAADLLRRLGDGVVDLDEEGASDADVRRLETERDAVQILTLHRAKGLEAPVVLLAFVPIRKRRDEKLRGTSVFHRGGVRSLLIDPTLLLQTPARAQAQVLVEQEDEHRRLLYVAATRAAARLVLPAFPPPEGEGGAKPFVFTPGYEAFNTRLVALLTDPETAPHVETRPLDDSAPPPRAERGARRPPAEIEVPAPPGADPDLARLRETRRAPILTSYSRIKRGAGARAPDLVTPEALRDDGADEAPADPQDDPILPGGVRTGLFLHALLETAPFETVRAEPDAAAFAARPEIRLPAEREAARHGLGPEAAQRGLEITHTVLRTPRRLGSVELPEGIAALPRHHAELPFVYPIPEASHPLLGRGGGASPKAHLDPSFEVERGWIGGTIDLVFEAGGRVFFLDWKSDRLAAYGPAALASHVRHHYALQARLYTLALARIYGLRDEARYEACFGGLAYVFLRAPPGQDLHFERPSFKDLMAWEADLLSGRLPLVPG